MLCMYTHVCIIMILYYISSIIAICVYTCVHIIILGYIFHNCLYACVMHVCLDRSSSVFGESTTPCAGRRNVCYAWYGMVCYAWYGVVWYVMHVWYDMVCVCMHNQDDGAAASAE